MIQISETVGIGFPIGQALKKTGESMRLPKDRAINELRGAINYLCGAIYYLETHKED